MAAEGRTPVFFDTRHYFWYLLIRGPATTLHFWTVWLMILCFWYFLIRIDTYWYLLVLFLILFDILAIIFDILWFLIRFDTFWYYLIRFHGFTSGGAMWATIFSLDVGWAKEPAFQLVLDLVMFPETLLCRHSHEFICAQTLLSFLFRCALDHKPASEFIWIYTAFQVCIISHNLYAVSQQACVFVLA